MNHNKKNTFIAWITKYALTKGVFSITAEDCDTSGKMICDTNSRTGGNAYYHDEGKDWHRTRESAVRRAKEMQKNKIASLKKSIERIRKLDFEESSSE